MRLKTLRKQRSALENEGNCARPTLVEFTVAMLKGLSSTVVASIYQKLI